MHHILLRSEIEKLHHFIKFFILSQNLIHFYELLQTFRLEVNKKKFIKL
jgi:hypothetical protein